MTEAKFIQQNSTAWKALEQSLRDKAGDIAGIEARIHLYRAVSGHLSYARAHFPSSTLCEYLGGLASQAHAAVYAHTQKRSVREFFLRTLPRLVRANAGFILASALLFLLAMATSFAATVFRPEYADAFLPVQYQGISPEDILSADGEREDWIPAIMANSIMVNNIQVSVLAFGLGLTCGVGTAWVLAYNGFMLGALGGIYARASRSLLFWSLILPHGILELAAIFIAGGAGLKIGYSLIRPGPYRRADALLAAGRNAVNLMVLAAILLCVAGVIEGFFTPSGVDPWIKLLFSACTALPLLFFLRKKEK